MFGLMTGLLRDAVTPILDRIANAGARLVRKIVLFALAGVCAIVVLIALTIAFDLWIATLAGPIVGALAVAGLYLAIAVFAIILALRDGSAPKKAAAPAAETVADAAPDPSEAAARIDQFTAPIMDMLQRYGFRREQLAVFAGATLAKRLGPLPIVGCAIVAGFLAGRMWKSWRHLLETALAASPLLAEILGQAVPRADADEPEPPRAEAAE